MAFEVDIQRSMYMFSILMTGNPPEVIVYRSRRTCEVHVILAYEVPELDYNGDIVHDILSANGI